MPKFLNQMMNEYDGGDTVITVKNVRLTAVLLCVLCVVVSRSEVGAGSFAHTMLPGSATMLILSKKPEFAGMDLSRRASIE